ncbi:MAG TPA: phosphoribosyltransferase [Xanthomonadales bacterium]|nr:phosphoribosyltransferase [Xanthomonadales bacterium]
MIFRDRRDAGRRLAGELARYRGREDVIVLALPRGGVPVGYEVAQALDVPLDVFLVRKLGVPGHEELAMGAIASGGVRVVNREVVTQLEIADRTLDAVAASEQQELERRERAFRGDRPAPVVRDHTIILVDDGLATGSTMRAAIAALKAQGPRRIVVAIPVAAPNTCQDLRREVDEVVCPMIPRDFRGVGQWYDDFEQTRDDEVVSLLDAARQRVASHAHG